MARAAGMFAAQGIEWTALAIRSIVMEDKVSYGVAAGRIMTSQDLFWSDDEASAIREAYAELTARFGE